MKADTTFENEVTVASVLWAKVLKPGDDYSVEIILSRTASAN